MLDRASPEGTGDPGLDRLNRLPRAQTVAELLACCGSRAWARTLADGRPFADREELFRTADRVWWSLPEEDWLEAFRAHPRIGEREPPPVERAPSEEGDVGAEGRGSPEERAPSEEADVGAEGRGSLAERAHTRSAEWSRREQAGVAGARRSVLDELAAGNRAYERRFGHVFLICATGRSAPEMLEALRARLTNAPEEELRIAAEEQRRITRLRLERLLSP